MFYSNEYEKEISIVELQSMFLVYVDFCKSTKQNLQYTESEFNQMIEDNSVPSEFIDSLVYHSDMVKNI